MYIRTKPGLGSPSRFIATARRLRRGGLALGVGLLSAALADDPAITTQPTSQCVSLGSLVQFRVAATTTNEPVTFQWQHSGTNLPNATSYLLRLTNVVAGQAGPYQAIVSNSLGHSVASQVAILRVDPTFTRILAGPQVTDAGGSTSLAWWDYDGDGLLDLCVSNGGTELDAFYHNTGDGTFTRVGTNAIARLGPSFDVAAGDYDNDGRMDLFMARPDGKNNDLFHNEGAGNFARRNRWQAGVMVGDGGHSYAAGWADYDNDGFIDLFVANNSKGNDCLYRNNGNGGFTKMTTNEVGLLVGDRADSVACAWADYDNDGYADLYVTADGATNYLYRNNRNGSFSQIIVDAATATGMGSGSWGDYDNDGLLDLFVAETTNGCALHRNLAGQGFVNTTVSAGLSSSVKAYLGAWGDYDNDGYLDLFVQSFMNTNVLFRNNGDGTFASADVGSPLSDGSRDLCAGWGDYDNDGFLDLFIAAGNGQPEVNLLYHNNGNSNGWLKVKILGNASNRSGIGAKVRIVATLGGRIVQQLREISGNSAWGGGSGPCAHFGLGDATNVTTIRVEWPSGNVQELTDTAPNQLLALTEPAQIRPVRPSASLNGSVTLRSSAGSAYQWRFEGEDLVGQTNVTLVLTNLAAEQAGHYSVAVSHASGTLATVTNFTYLQVDTQFTKITTGPIVAGNESGWACSWADYDDDGDIDLLVANGYEATGLERLGLYRNEGQGQFVRLTNEVGSLVGPAGRYGGGIWADYDNDGHLDCLVTDWTANNGAGLLHRNLGNGTFERVTASAAPLTLAPFSVVAWGDYDNDGWLDAFNPCAYAGPGVPTNQMFHATGGGGFENVCSGAPVQDRFTLCEGAAWADFDGDGDLDLLATDPHAWEANNNAYPNHFYRNDGNGVFTRIATNAVALDRGWALAPAWGDYDNDGRLDLFLSFYSGTSRLFHNAGDGVFTRTLLGPSLETIQPAWADFDNDGDLDLYVSRGQSTATTNLFYLNNGDGTFSANAAGSPAADIGRSMGCAWGDYDNDGCLDLVVVNTRGDQDCLYHNNGNGNHWLMVQLKGTTSNASAIGAKVRVYALVQGKPTWQLREISGSEKCQKDPRAHFGLGESSVAAKLRVEWPSGTVQELTNVAANQILTIVEPRRPVLTGGVRAADGAFVLSVAADAGQQVRIYASSDLTGWVEVGQWTGNGQTLELPPLSGARFFKAEVVE